MHLRDELAQRGFLYQYTHDELFDDFDQGGKALYFGCDPTAESLHLGNFCVFMQAVNYMKRGNKLYLIVGGATGMIGDPGGKDSERSFLSPEQLDRNIASITSQVQGMLEHLRDLSGYDFEFEVINNADFYQDMNYIQFLRDVGKHITINYMMTKETVKKRIEDPAKSISYTEFSYMLLQSYDYLRLYQDHGVTLQIAGSDQRGNITTGSELIRKKLDQTVYGATGPLVLDATGRKFGKSEGNAIWLDPTMNTPYSVYQYFLNTADEDVERYLKLFTLLSFDEIEAIVTQHNEDTARRYGQEQLAIYVITTIFGTEAATQAATITDILFGSSDLMADIAKLDPDTQSALCDATGAVRLPVGSYRATELAVSAGLASSNGEAKKLIKSTALSINGEKITDIGAEVELTDRLLVRKGKKGKVLILVA